MSDNRWYSRNSGQHYLHHCAGQWRNEEFLQPSSLLPCHHWHPLHHHCSHWLFLRKRQVWSIRGKIYGLLHIQWNSMIFYDLLWPNINQCMTLSIPSNVWIENRYLVKMFKIIFLEFCWPFDLDSEIYAILFPKFLFPINNIIFNASIFLTIVIAYER